MKIGRMQVVGSFALLALTAVLIFLPHPLRSSGDTRPPDVPYTIEKPGMIAVELTGESGRNGIYFIPKGTTLAGFLTMAGIAQAGSGRAPVRSSVLRSPTTVIVPSSPDHVEKKPMAAQRRLVLGIPIDLNRSTLEDLVLVPGIGEKTAGMILERRQNEGPFRNLEELMEVKGIKEKRFEKLRRYLCIWC